MVSSHIVRMVLVRLGVDCILQSVIDLRTKLRFIASERLSVTKLTLPGIFHEVYKILGLPTLMTVSSLAVSFEEYNRGSLSSFPARCY